jgi:hypothetical protein
VIVVGGDHDRGRSVFYVPTSGTIDVDDGDDDGPEWWWLWRSSPRPSGERSGPRGSV